MPIEGNPIPKLFDSVEDFNRCFDAGIKLMTDGPFLEVPDSGDLQQLKELLSVFIVDMLSLDPNMTKDPDFDKRMMSLRMSVLAVYNIGRKRGSAIVV